MLSRPQPIGVLPLPAGWLVLPSPELVPEAGEIVRRLLSGHLPEAWPDALEAFARAAEGEVEAAAALIDPTGGGIAAYNHFVLTGEESSLDAARAAVSEALSAGKPQDGADAASGAADLAALVEVAAYSLGRPAQLPDDADLAELTGEIAAHVLSARAAAALEHGDPQTALDALVAAEAAARPVSAVLGALLLGQQASLLQEVNGADADVVEAYREAVDALRGLDAVEPAMAELALGQATAYQELASRSENAQHLLVEAVKMYHLALRLLRKDSQPQRYAFAHSNLALAYLAMPMGDARDKLRRGVAVQSLREALAYYTREQHPAEWSMVTLNLANALQHLPTTHPVENLVEAVGMYEELLAVRTPEADPLGHARVLANQGTALAHLGIHDQAGAKLDAAREIFTRFGDHGSVATVDAALADITAVAGGPVGEDATAGTGDR